jgi:hypothetical protein
MPSSKTSEAAAANPDASPRNAARRGFATVQLTMLSIVVALILENLLGTLFELEHWTPLILLQALAVLGSSFSLWVGFGLALTLVNKQPSYSDFLNPFFTLILLSLAVRSIATGNIAGFFLASALASASSTFNLWGEVRTAAQLGVNGPTTSFRLLLVTTTVEVIATTVMWLGWGNLPMACGFLLVAFSLQASASAHSIRIWRRVTA